MVSEDVAHQGGSHLLAMTITFDVAEQVGVITLYGSVHRRPRQGGEVRTPHVMYQRARLSTQARNVILACCFAGLSFEADRHLGVPGLASD